MSEGYLSVDTEHLFPIIKKWLYSEKDIFIREVVSNACDAITKHQRLVSLSEAEESSEPYRIDISFDSNEKTITVSDNGIGMTYDEVDNYINHIALSGALDFVSKYENEGGTGIIGHFGLGFYSLFMVSNRVVLNTKSYQDAESVKWECSEVGQFSMEKGDRETRGTEITMFLLDEEDAYADYDKLKSVLNKYCSFMPFDIFLHKDDSEEKVNDTSPLWQKNISKCTDEEYIEFYKNQFHEYADPSFWFHINADYPLNFKGILYIPAPKNDFEPQESEIRLFYNSVFVADNIKEVCPEFLVNMKGILDCPELPLNVSRSYLQNDAYVRKVSAHIVKKVADRLNQLFTQNREDFEKNWPSIKPYIEYGCVRDEKFYERTKDIILYKKYNGDWCSVNEYLNGASEGTVYYTTDVKSQNYYLDLFAGKNIPVLIFDTLMDSSYAQFLESKNDKIKFRRIDAELDAINEKDDIDTGTLENLFKDAIGKENAQVKFVSLGENDAPALISTDEENRRFADMMRMYSVRNGEKESTFPVEETLTVNMKNTVVSKLIGMDNEEKAKVIARHIYLSALLLSRDLTNEEMKEYIDLNAKILLEY